MYNCKESGESKSSIVRRDVIEAELSEGGLVGSVRLKLGLCVLLLLLLLFGSGLYGCCIVGADSPNAAVGRRGKRTQESTLNGAVEVDKVSPTATTNVLVAEGFKGAIRHWFCCFGSGALILIIAGCLFALHKSLKSRANDTSSTNDTSDVSERSNNGAFEFLLALVIFGFITGGLAIFACLFTWLRHPEQRRCDQIPLFGKWFPDSCSESFQCCVDDGEPGCFSAWWANCTKPDDTPSCFSTCCTGLRHSWEDCCDCSAPAEPTTCPDCSCGSCGCGSCSDCAADCGCLSCADCCYDCNTCYTEFQCSMPSCDCCPSCDGCAGCCSTIYKIVCCKCKIEVS